MMSYVTDNSDGGDILRSVTWQYDNAPNFVFIIMLLKEVYEKTTAAFFDALSRKLNLRIKDVDAFGLSVIGATLGIPRMGLTDEQYRKFIIGKFILLNSDATLEDYRSYTEYAFDGLVSVTDGLDMGLTLSVSEDALDEIKAIVNNYPDSIIPYPSGVRSAMQSNAPVFGLAEQVQIKNNDTLVPLYEVGNRDIVVVLTNNRPNNRTVRTGSSFVYDGVKYINNDTQFVLAPGASGMYIYSPESNNAGSNIKFNDIISSVFSASGAVITDLACKVMFVHSNLTRSVETFTTDEIGQSTITRLVIYGDSGTSLPDGTKFIYKDSEFLISSPSSIPNEGFRRRSFVSESRVFVPKGTRLQILNSSGNAITGISEAITYQASYTDFNLETLDNSSISWDRKGK